MCVQCFYVCVHMVFVYRVAEHTDKTRVTVIICVHMVTIYVSICLCTELLSIETRRADIPRVFSLIEINQHVESVNYVYV